MATRIQRIENTLLNKVYVKSEQALKEMVDDGQLQILSEYFTPDSDIEIPAMPIGSIFASAIPQTDARVHLLDGSTISQTGVYADFANLIKALHFAGNNISCTQSEFDADVSTYGQCGKFVIDNDNGNIRLPLITEFIASNNGGQTIGLAELDSFKSHEHSVKNGQGRYIQISSTSGSYAGGRISGATAYYDESNEGYTVKAQATGDSETKPKNVRYPYYIVLASGYKSSQVVDVDNIMNEVNSKATLLEAYPVGSIYMSTNSKSPASLFGGTWERLKDRFLLGAGDNYTEIYKDNKDGTYEGVGGSATVTLTASQMPSHGHSGVYVNNTGLSCGVGTGVNGFLRLTSTTTSGSINSELHTGNAGGGQAHENMPPYATVYMWQRVEDDNGSDFEPY